MAQYVSFMYKLALVLFKETYSKTHNLETANIAFDAANILSQELHLSAEEQERYTPAFRVANEFNQELNLSKEDVAWYEAYRGYIRITKASDEEATAYATRIVELATFD